MGLGLFFPLVGFLTACRGEEPPAVEASRAAVVMTRIGHSVVIHQEVVADLTPKTGAILPFDLMEPFPSVASFLDPLMFAKPANSPFEASARPEWRLTEQVSGEDLELREDFYAAFPAGPAGAPEDGFFVLRMAVEGGRPDIGRPAVVEFRDLRFTRDKKGGTFAFEARGTGRIEGELLYSRDPGIRTVSFALPRGGEPDPRPRPIYQADSLIKLAQAGFHREPSKEWGTSTFSLTDEILKAADVFDRLDRAIERLDECFGSKKEPQIWNWNALTHEEVVKALADDLKPGKVLMEIRADKQERRVLVGRERFVPILTKKIALRVDDGQLIGGELRLSVEPH